MMDQLQERWRSEGTLAADRIRLHGAPICCSSFLIFVVGPVVSAIYLSFTYFNILEAPALDRLDQLPFAAR